MLRRRDTQSVPHRVAEDSFHGRMGAVSEELFKDDDLAEMYCPDNGRPTMVTPFTRSSRVSYGVCRAMTNAWRIFSIRIGL